MVPVGKDATIKVQTKLDYYKPFDDSSFDIIYSTMLFSLDVYIFKCLTQSKILN